MDPNEIQRERERMHQHYQRLIGFYYITDNEISDEAIQLMEQAIRRSNVPAFVCNCPFISVDEDRCGAMCVLRGSWIECGCMCINCTNRRIQERLFAQVEMICTGFRTYGLFSLQPITMGDLIIEFTGVVIIGNFPTSRLVVRIPHTDIAINAQHAGNESRAIRIDPNNANCSRQIWTVAMQFRVVYVATRAINPQDEIIFDGHTYHNCSVNPKGTCPDGTPGRSLTMKQTHRPGVYRGIQPRQFPSPEMLAQEQARIFRQCYETSRRQARQQSGDAPTGRRISYQEYQERVRASTSQPPVQEQGYFTAQIPRGQPRSIDSAPMNLQSTNVTGRTMTRQRQYDAWQTTGNLHQQRPEGSTLERITPGIGPQATASPRVPSYSSGESSNTRPPSRGHERATPKGQDSFENAPSPSQPRTVSPTAAFTVSPEALPRSVQASPCSGQLSPVRNLPSVTTPASIEGQPATQRPRIASPGSFCHDPTGILPIVEDPAPGQDLDSCQEQGEQDPNDEAQPIQEFLIELDDATRSAASSGPRVEGCQEYNIEFQNGGANLEGRLQDPPTALTSPGARSETITGPRLVLVQDRRSADSARTTSPQNRHVETATTGLEGQGSEAGGVAYEELHDFRDLIVLPANDEGVVDEIDGVDGDDKDDGDDGDVGDDGDDVDFGDDGDVGEVGDGDQDEQPNQAVPCISQQNLQEAVEVAASTGAAAAEAGLEPDMAATVGVNAANVLLKNKKKSKETAKICSFCGAHLTTSQEKVDHEDDCEKNPHRWRLLCPYNCGKSFSTRNRLKEHKANKCPNRPAPINDSQPGPSVGQPRPGPSNRPEPLPRLRSQALSGTQPRQKRQLASRSKPPSSGQPLKPQTSNIPKPKPKARNVPPPPPVQDAPHFPDAPTGTRERQRTCQYCGQLFALARIKDTHEMGCPKRPGGSPFKCKYCGVAYVKEASLKAHSCNAKRLAQIKESEEASRTASSAPDQEINDDDDPSTRDSEQEDNEGEYGRRLTRAAASKKRSRKDRKEDDEEPKQGPKKRSKN